MTTPSSTTTSSSTRMTGRGPTPGSRRGSLSDPESSLPAFEDRGDPGHHLVVAPDGCEECRGPRAPREGFEPDAAVHLPEDEPGRGGGGVAFTRGVVQQARTPSASSSARPDEEEGTCHAAHHLPEEGLRGHLETGEPFAGMPSSKILADRIFRTGSFPSTLAKREKSCIPGKSPGRTLPLHPVVQAGPSGRNSGRSGTWHHSGGGSSPGPPQPPCTSSPSGAGGSGPILALPGSAVSKAMTWALAWTPRSVRPAKANRASRQSSKRASLPAAAITSPSTVLLSAWTWDPKNPSPR